MGFVPSDAIKLSHTPRPCTGSDIARKVRDDSREADSSRVVRKDNNHMTVAWQTRGRPRGAGNESVRGKGPCSRTSEGWRPRGDHIRTQKRVHIFPRAWNPRWDQRRVDASPVAAEQGKAESGDYETT